VCGWFLNTVNAENKLSGRDTVEWWLKGGGTTPPCRCPFLQLAYVEMFSADDANVTLRIG
jgi:hypothetical protein